MLIFAFLPILVFILLIFFSKIKLSFISFIFFITTLVLTLFLWRMDYYIAAASILKGILIALDILLIVFGALLFLKIIKDHQIINQLCLYLEKISPDYRIQVILIAWVFQSFMEGITGFGTPITIAAPILVSIGLTPITAVATSLLGNSTSVSFGAAGTPIRVGLSGLNITKVPFYSALISLIGFIVPLFMLWLVTRRRPDSKTHFFEAIPFAIFSGFSVVIPSFLAVFVGPEFPSIIGPIIGLFLIIFAVKFNLFLPSKIRSLNRQSAPTRLLPLYQTLFPYFLLIVLLIISKIFLSPLSFDLNFGLNHRLVFFNPGLIFIFTSIILALIWHLNFKDFFSTVIESFRKSIDSFIIISLISAVTQLMIHSHQNSTNLPSFLEIIAASFQTRFLPFITPFIGTFGSFMNGSTTISNLMFGGILQTVSLNLGLNSSIILSLQNTGSSAGNMISLADVIPALAILNLSPKAVTVIKMVFIPCLIYVILIGIIGFLIV